MITGHVIAQEPHFLQTLGSIAILTIWSSFGLALLVQVDVESYHCQQDHGADRGKTTQRLVSQETGFARRRSWDQCQYGKYRFNAYEYHVDGYFAVCHFRLLEFRDLTAR
jgi:hypothetical protein